MARAVEQDMWPAGGAGMSMTEACEEIAKRPRTYADKLDFFNRLPEVQRALMDS
jgi:hypothetical protein